MTRFAAIAAPVAACLLAAGLMEPVVLPGMRLLVWAVLCLGGTVAEWPA